MLALVAWVSFASPVLPPPNQSAAPPELIADLELAGSAVPALDTLLNPVFELNGDVYFSARIAGLAAELWRTDGTVPGSGRVTEFAVVSDVLGSKSIQAAALPGDRFVFSTTSKAYGNELFLVDPNVPGTTLVRDLVPGFSSSQPSTLTSWRGFVWFLADDEIGRRNLWRTDGTSAGTVLDPVTSFPELELIPGEVGLTVAGDQLFITTEFLGENLYVKPDPGVLGVPLASFGNGVFGGSTGVLKQLATVGSRLVFNGSTANVGAEPWVSDGTLAGTSLLMDLVPGAGGSTPTFYGSDGGLLWFNASTPSNGRELWVTDGTAAGTALAWETVAGSGSSVFEEYSRGLAFAGGLLFTAVGATGNEVWFLDGPAGAASLLLTTTGVPTIGAYGFMESAGRAYFFTESASSTSSTASLWVTDGTPGGTQLASVGAPGEVFSSTGLGTTAQGFVFGGFGPEGLEPRLTLGTPGTTSLLGNLSVDVLTLGSTPLSPVRLRDGVAFSAANGASGREPYFSDGSAGGTVSLGDLMPAGTDSSPRALGVVGDRLLFAAESAGLGRELWRTDGTLGGTELVLDLFPGAASGFLGEDDPAFNEGPAVLDGVAYFFAEGAQGRGLWRSDGTASGTFGVKLLGNLGGGSQFLVASDSQLFFRALAPGQGVELWASDGTEAGTRVVADLKPGALSSGLGELTPYGERVLYRYNGPGGQQLGISDGTAAGTLALGGSATAAMLTAPQGITVLGDLAVFSTLAPGAGRELGVTDGTQAGTVLLSDLEPGQAGANPLWLAAVGDRVYFFASVTAGSTFKQNRLWATDGTSAGTFIVDDAPGEGSRFQSRQITPVGSDGRFVFEADDLEHGEELWISDGTEAGTRLLADLTPGQQPSVVHWVLGSGNRVLLSATNGVTGAELFAFDLELAETWLFGPFGDSCGAELWGSGTAQLGGTANVELSSATPLANTFLFFSLNQDWFEFGKGCTQYLADPGLLAVGVTDAQGASTESLAVPNVSAVIGLELYFQVLVEASGGPLLGAFELSNALEAVIGG